MQLIYDQISPAIPQLMREMAIYFAQFRPVTGQTLYCRLIDSLQSTGLLDRVVFSTLNYECVLEFSLIRKRIRINLFHPLSDHNNVPVWKLHGSCNMFATQVTATPGVMYSAGVTFSGGIEALFDTSEVIGRCLAGTALAPVMCLYMRGKPLNVAASNIKALQSMWQSTVRDSAAVFCVGVNPYPADGHIWTPIAETCGNVHFIGSRMAFDEWKSVYRPKGSDFIADRFGDGLTEIIRRLAEYAA